MIYLDNAATGGFKPSIVLQTAQNVMRYLCANPSRSSHRLALTGAEIIYETRKRAATLFGAKKERIIFTKNCTEALNTAIFGINPMGGTVITTAYEHNSVLRPLYSLKQRGKINLAIADTNNVKDLPKKIASMLNEKVKLVVVNALSNVTGDVLPISEIGKILKSANVPFIVDGAQAGGHIPLNVEKENISCLCLAGHKGLYGIMGSGLLVLNSKTEISPLIYGGTGTESLNLEQPCCYPEKLESGTQNLIGIAALNEGLKYVERNQKSFAEILYKWTDWVGKELKKIKKVKVYSAPNPAGIVSFDIQGIPSGEVADILNGEFDMAVRSGLHCAPLIHKKLKTEENGLTRASFSVQNTERELAEFCRAVNVIASR